VTTAAKLLMDEAEPGSATLDDPAWPATYSLSNGVRALLKQCERPRCVSALIGGGLICDIAALQNLVEEGLLVTCSEWAP